MFGVPSCACLTKAVCVLQSAIDEAKVNLNKTRDAFQHVINKAKDPNKNE